MCSLKYKGERLVTTLSLMAFHTLDIYTFLITLKSDLRYTLVNSVNPKRYLLSYSVVINPDRQIINRYSSMKINGSLHLPSKGIFHRAARISYSQFSE